MSQMIKHSRWLTAFIAFCCIVVALSIPKLSVTYDDFGEPIWPWMFGIGSVLCVAYTVAPWSRILWIHSGAVVCTAMIGRAVDIAIGMLTLDGTIAIPQAHISGAVWTLSAVLSMTVWMRVFGPVTALLEGSRKRKK